MPHDRVTMQITATNEVEFEPILRRVSEVAELTGVTVRTLHHYDAMGLVTPGERSDSGYRLYTPEDLTRLREVLTWRRLGVPLREIGALLDDPQVDRLEVLRRQRVAITEQAEQLDELARAIDAAIAEHDGSSQMIKTDQAIIEALGGFDPAEYEAEAMQRWGDTDAYSESQHRTNSYGPEDWKQIKAEADEIVAALAALHAAGAEPDEDEVLEAAERHRDHITARFYECTPEIHRGLGELYVSDPRFRGSMENDGERPGFAEFLRDAFAANASRIA